MRKVEKMVIEDRKLWRMDQEKHICSISNEIEHMTSMIKILNMRRRILRRQLAYAKRAIIEFDREQ